MAGKAGLPGVRRSRVVAGGAIAVVIGGVVAAASVIPSSGLAGPSPDRATVTDLPSGAVSLVAFDSCEAALSGFRRAALPHIGPYGFANGYALATRGGGAIPDAVPAMPGAAAAPPQQQKREQAQDSAGAGSQAPGHSATNNHEANVDEPDVVKTDGKRIVSVVDGRLKVIDVASRKITGTLDVPDVFVSQMLISGDRALLVANQDHVVYDVPTPRGKPAPPIYPGGAMGSKLVLVDLAGTPKVLGTLEVSGLYVDARQVGTVARVVVRSQPKLKFSYPDGTQSPTTAQQKNRDVALESSIDDWLPGYRLDSGGTKTEGRLVDCAKVSHPADYSGTAMLTVLTIDLTKALEKGDPVTVAADGDTVYGTDKSLYVADDHFSRMVPMQAPPATTVPDRTALGRTQIHRFDIAGSAPPKYAGSGEVEGTLLNQYSLSEHDGHLRVATTTWPADAVPQGSQPQSHSIVTVLARGDKGLTQVGRVDGLGKGERIYAVRFFGTVGYVVTFRQVDPLYTLDLSQPARPRVAGELKITGYSAYLHPVGPGKVLGVGQEATEQGRRLGAQVSLFDVGNPATPNRLAQQRLEGGSSEVEYDPHAFLHWPARNLVVVPVTGKGAGVRAGEWQQSNHALVLRIDGDALVEVGRVAHPTGMIRRSMVIGDELWTVSESGLMASDLDRLGQRGWVPLR
ncbi:beta-propeller domain-containing protein [Kibdelosporangium persicum]|uniref:Secreted protein containing C-terminal beta-propeller domain n=1 Tax=Kibdelosporangium persicum TaxID=2698649 RepID=A0ABX2F2S4_9PSEU|nr:beta-propeller domain-containing protein [Kibdelosporangium persicum]NRN65621.1 Secreted protein containing C-terminal beta-propeller domain [Kibdelosporangium persicum]